jgi:AcrR family transcriptional regulator
VTGEDAAPRPFPFTDRQELRRAEGAPTRARRTRERLSQALIELLSEKPYDQISLQDIVQRAGVIRATFYLHFAEKNDLFGYVMQDAADEFLRLLMTAPRSWDLTPDRLAVRYEHILRHIGEHAALFRTALCAPGASPYALYFMEALQAYAVESVRALAPDAIARDEDKIAMIGRFCAAGFTGLWKWWLETDMRVPIPVVAAQTADLMLHGPLASAAIEHGIS